MSDALSVRVNLNEVTIWLSTIFSWLTPYEWYVDVAIVVGVSVWNYAIIKDNHEEAKRAAQR